MSYAEKMLARVKAQPFEDYCGQIIFWQNAVKKEQSKGGE